MVHGQPREDRGGHPNARGVLTGVGSTPPDKIARIEELIEKHGVKYIYYQFVSINGRVLAKVVPAVHLRRNLEDA